MKVKTSITLSEDLLREIDGLAAETQNRSEFIERALRFFIEKKLQKEREGKDLQILNAEADDLNREAEDVLSYQVEL